LPHTPVTILTGFLGSGKTTLLNRAMRDPAMAKTAVVINEFGEVPLDHMLAAQSDDTIMVLENGCLCCTVFGDLVVTLNNLYHRREDGDIPRFDHVVIETSGLADPSPLIQAFLSDPTLAGLYRIAAVIATVDAVNGPHTLDEHVESVRQVALADQIFITKLDLVDPAKAKADEAALTARLRRLNPAAKISSIDAQTFDIAAVLRSDALAAGGETDQVRAWLNAAAYQKRDDDAHGHSHDHHDHGAHDHHHLHDRDIASFCFIREQPIPREALRLLLDALQQNLGPNLLRVQGLINVVGDPGRATPFAQSHVPRALAGRRSAKQDRVHHPKLRPRRGRGHDCAARPRRDAHRRGAGAGPSAIAKCDQRIARGAPLTT
jgi:G3E family GTPase